MLANREAGHGAQAAAWPRLRGRCVQRASEDEAPACEWQHRPLPRGALPLGERAKLALSVPPRGLQRANDSLSPI